MHNPYVSSFLSLTALRYFPQTSCPGPPSFQTPEKWTLIHSTLEPELLAISLDLKKVPRLLSMALSAVKLISLKRTSGPGSATEEATASDIPPHVCLCWSWLCSTNSCSSVDDAAEEEASRRRANTVVDNLQWSKYAAVHYFFGHFLPKSGKTSGGTPCFILGLVRQFFWKVVQLQREQYRRRATSLEGPSLGTALRHGE